MVTAHLENSHDVKSDFSSWASCYDNATRCGTESTHIAILDTELLKGHVRIYHVPEFLPAGETRSCYDHEYLAYGPIPGSMYHVVSRKDMKKAGLYKLCPPGGCGPYPKRPVVGEVKRLVGVGKKVASLFLPTRHTRPDIIIALTVSFATLIYCGWSGYPELD